ncbi:MAG: hypothetical protein R3362_00775 [Rhodothermales bacterium]|nr:hypothetical protein [Rhodothermales bacterium]
MRYLKTPFRFLSVLVLSAGMLAFTACQEEAPEPVEDQVEAEVGPIEEELVTETTDYYEAWDTDTDARLTADEFGMGYEAEAWWEDWDADDDSYLSEDEFNTTFSGYTWYTPTLYGDWDADADGLLTEDEWETGLFDTWDADDDTYLTQEEWDADLF